MALVKNGETLGGLVNHADKVICSDGKDVQQNLDTIKQGLTYKLAEQSATAKYPSVNLPSDFNELYIQVLWSNHSVNFNVPKSAISGTMRMNNGFYGNNTDYANVKINVSTQSVGVVACTYNGADVDCSLKVFYK